MRRRRPHATAGGNLVVARCQPELAARSIDPLPRAEPGRLVPDGRCRGPARAPWPQVAVDPCGGDGAAAAPALTAKLTTNPGGSRRPRRTGLDGEAHPDLNRSRTRPPKGRRTSAPLPGFPCEPSRRAAHPSPGERSCSPFAHRRCAYAWTSQHTATVNVQVRRTTVDAAGRPGTGWWGSNPGIPTTTEPLTWGSVRVWAAVGRRCSPIAHMPGDVGSDWQWVLRSPRVQATDLAGGGFSSVAPLPAPAVGATTLGEHAPWPSSAEQRPRTRPAHDPRARRQEVGT
jgi:hypothetical protein